MRKKYLPIGTVCDIKKNNKKIMIIGYCSPEFNGNLNIMDYIGCAYPEGLLLPSHIVSFNHSDVMNVHFLGFKNDEQERLDSLLNKMVDNDVERAKEFYEDNEMYLTSNNVYSKLLFDENGVVMLAENKPKTNYEFDENGYVINVENTNEVENPFFKKFNNVKNDSNDEDHSKWNIFKKIEFDENGSVVEAQTTTFENKNKLLNEIEFDENGIVISDNTENIYQTSNYKFDENGEIIAEETYEFDENGNLVSINNKEKEEEIPPIGPGLPGYVSPREELENSEFKEEYKFDENGTLISIGDEQMEEYIPPIGPGLPGYVEPQKKEKSKYKFDENGTVIESN